MYNMSLVLWVSYVVVFFFFFKQKTAYEMRISDWSSDVCSSDLHATRCTVLFMPTALSRGAITACTPAASAVRRQAPRLCGSVTPSRISNSAGSDLSSSRSSTSRSEEHTSELQSLMRISYAVFCLKKKKSNNNTNITIMYYNHTTQLPYSNSK